MRKIAHQRCLLGFFLSGFFQRPTAKAPKPIFTRNTSNDAVPRKDVPFRGIENKNLTFTPVILEKPPFLGPILTGQNFRRTIEVLTLYNGVLYLNSP